VHSVSAAVFAIGYLCAVVTPVLGGFVWDVTGVPWAAFVPAGSFGAVIVALASGLELAPRGGPRERPA
jgi:cyanate permease